MTKKPEDRESYYERAADVWQRGCRGDTLSEREYRGFLKLARDRFYTFTLSVQHSRLQGDADKVQSLIRSLALDLVRAPGLEAEWLRSEWADDEFGALVTAMLDDVRDRSGR